MPFHFGHGVVVGAEHDLLRQERCKVSIVLRLSDSHIKSSFYPLFSHNFRSGFSNMLAENGNRRAVALRNEAPDEVLRQAVLLRSCTGRKASLQVKNRTQTQRSSIQGVWNAKLQDQLKSQNPPQ